MNDTTTDQKRQPPRPPREFWEALLLVYRQYLQRELGSYWLMPEPLRIPLPVLSAIRLLDCWIDIALEEKRWDEQETEDWLD